MFDQSPITDQRPPEFEPAVGGVLLQWSSTAPAGTEYQVYVARKLAWHGRSKWTIVPLPTARARIDIGAVGPGEGSTDFSASLPAAVNDRANLTWLGGTYLDASGNDDVAGFNVYRSAAAGGAVDYTSRIAQLAAYDTAEPSDGWGLGGWGQGGWGRSAASYAYTSDPLGNGVWTWAVRPFDAAGNEATGSTVDVTIVAPPAPPAAFADGSRLAYTYDASTHEVTLTWNASPG